MSERLIRLRARGRVRKRPEEARDELPTILCSEETQEKSVLEIDRGVGGLKLKPYFGFPKDSMVAEEEEEKGNNNFVCRSCESGKYKELRESNGVIGPGFHSRITGYECCGCSVRFGDPDKFSKKKESGK